MSLSTVINVSVGEIVFEWQTGGRALGLLFGLDASKPRVEKKLSGVEGYVEATEVLMLYLREVPRQRYVHFILDEIESAYSDFYELDAADRLSFERHKEEAEEKGEEPKAWHFHPFHFYLTVKLLD